MSDINEVMVGYYCQIKIQNFQIFHTPNAVELLLVALEKLTLNTKFNI